MNSAKVRILCEIHNADKTNLRTAIVRSLKEIKAIGRDAFHYPANIQIKVLLAANGVEIENDAMLKDFSASMPGILKIQLLTSEDSETGAGAENLNSGRTNSGDEGENDSSSNAFKGPSFYSTLSGVAAGSLFATMRSAGTVGLAATGIGAVALGGAAALAIGAYQLGKYMNDRKHTDEK